MFLKTNRPTRRGFLERSALGAGSILLAPLLLESCTDHIIPNPPTNPTNPPQVPSASPIDLLYWYDQAKAVIITGLSLPPQPGGFMGSLLNTLWPDGQLNVWIQAKAQIEDAVDLGQQINEATFLRAVTALNSLKNSIGLYLVALNSGSPEQINDQWEAVTDQFVDSQSFFMAPGYELLLLPLLTQFANLYLALLRDGVAFGQSWGRSDGLHQQDIQTLQSYIQEVTQEHVTGWYKVGRTEEVNDSTHNDYYGEPFLRLNKYDRGMTLLVLDFMTMWPYFDVSHYPNGMTPVLTREIYSDPVGRGPITPITSVPTQLPTQLTVWGLDEVDAFQLTYPAGGGPGGVTDTGRMGDQGGNNVAPYGGTFNLTPDNPITQFRDTYETWTDDDDVNHGPFVIELQFGFYDGTLTNKLGGQSLEKPHYVGHKFTDTGWLGYGAYEALSSVHVSGASGATGIVLGFTYWQPPQETLNTIRGLYVTSVPEHSADEFANAFPKLGITGALITDELKAARKAYWAQMKK